MYPEYDQVDQYENQPISPAEAFELEEIEHPAVMQRIFAEIVFYFITLTSVFPSLTPMGGIPHIRGILLMLTGFIGFILLITERHGLPMSVWFAIIINITANLNQVIVHGDTPLIGDGVISFFQWVSSLIMVCYIVQNNAAAKRLLLFYSFLVIAAVYHAGGSIVTIATEATERFSLKYTGFATVFSDPNQLGTLSAVLIIACLFWSLRASRLFRPFLWGISGVLIIILFLTVSRGGLIIFAFGLVVLFMAIMISRNVRMGGVILIVVFIIGVFLSGSILIGQIEQYSHRFSKAAVGGRLGVYSMTTIEYLWETKIIGAGPGTKLRNTGVTPHNSFVSTHLDYGGITAWLYLIWVIVLGVRVLMACRHKDLPTDITMLLIALFGMGLINQIASNGGFVTFTVVYVTAIVERYTAPYSKRRLREREFAEWNLLQDQDQPSQGDEVAW